MKIKIAFALSIFVNAVLLTAVTYIMFSEVPLRNEPIIIINHAAPSEQSKNASSTAPSMAALPN